MPLLSFFINLYLKKYLLLEFSVIEFGLSPGDCAQAPLNVDISGWKT
jgi:hypothetical protein